MYGAPTTVCDIIEVHLFQPKTSERKPVVTTLTTELNWDALTNEAVKHLQALIRCNTANPPGNEGPAIAYIREWLTAEGIDSRIIEPTVGRPSIWARLPGNGSKRPLLLLSHVDVVPVEHEHWTVDPFGGVISNGYIYGRGAIDMKSMVAKELALFLHLARALKETGHSLDRDLILLAVADEEQNGTHGMAWIAEHEPELLEAEYALNEGGGSTLSLGEQRIYLCATAEKGRVLVTLQATGSPGHGSIPHNNNAIVRLSRALHRLASFPLPLHRTTTVQQFVQTLIQTQPQPKRMLFSQVLNPLVSETILRTLLDVSTANGLRAMLHNTASPTKILAGTALNVIPTQAVAHLDGRIIPGQTAESLTQELRARIHDPHVTIETKLISLGHESSADTELFRAIKTAIATYDPGAMVVPYMLPALTDSHFLVPKGVAAYGFDPMQPEQGWPPLVELAHGHDERISIANIRFGLRVLYDVIKRMC
jgi:acetylornithine deacetylase/succinyl-diaminopimelate desuccinylase-like protein